MERIHHSDVIGSLLRPRYLTQARDEYAAGQLGAPAFKRPSSCRRASGSTSSLTVNSAGSRFSIRS